MFKLRFNQPYLAFKSGSISNAFCKYLFPNSISPKLL